MMASALKRLFSGGDRQSYQDAKRPQIKVDDSYQTIQDDQPHNPYTEALLLNGHSGPIHQIYHIDHHRFVTVSEDTLIIVWDTQTGCQLQTLRGHTAAVTCVLHLSLSSDSSLLLSGSLDSTLRLWTLAPEELLIQDGPCVRVAVAEGTIRCLTQLGHNLLCSGGHDLCIWDGNGTLLDHFDRSSLSDTSDIHSILRLETAHISVVAASDNKCLSVYDVEKMMLTDRGGGYRFRRDQKRRYLNQSHNYPITFLSGISASFFASGCHGGSIIVWSVQHLSALKIFYPLPQPLAKEVITTEFTKVSSIEVVAERYVFAAVGCGFKMYDVLGQDKDSQGHPKPLVSHTCAHLLPLTSLTFLLDRAQLVTVGEDRTVKLWGNPGTSNSSRQSKKEPEVSPVKAAIESFIGPTGKKATSTSTSTVVPLLLGELHLHSGVIKVLTSLEEEGIVTGGDDGSLIYWKDGEKERERRERDIHTFIRGQCELPN